PPYSMYGSFIPPDGITAFVGIDAVVDIIASQDSMPDWWKHGAGMCRGSTALVTSVDFTSGPFTCEDVFLGVGAMGYLYSIPYSAPNRARLEIQAAIPYESATPLDATKEYYAFRTSVQRSRTVGDGSCTGCSVPVCLFLDHIQIFQQPVAGFDPYIYGY